MGHAGGGRGEVRQKGRRGFRLGDEWTSPQPKRQGREIQRRQVRDLLYHPCSELRSAESAANPGVAGSCNRALNLAGGEFLVLLHDDVVTSPGWLAPLLATATAHPEAEAIGSCEFNADGTPQRSGSILWSNGMTSPVAVPADNQGHPWPVDYCGTCALMVRTALWDALGGLDEQIYPAYFVDLDLCMGLRKIGSTVVCNAKSSVRHHSHSSSSTPFGDFVNQQNRTYFPNKRAAALPGYEPWLRKILAPFSGLASAPGKPPMRLLHGGSLFHTSHRHSTTLPVRRQGISFLPRSWPGLGRVSKLRNYRQRRLRPAPTRMNESPGSRTK